MSHKPLIGILAGMGPKSTGPFIDQVVEAFQRLTGAKNDIDFPPMMIYSLPTPFYVDRPIDHALIEKTICGGLKKLKACGVSLIAMPCNTAHLYFPKLEQCVQMPLLNMVDLTLARIPKNAHKVTVLGTHPTIESQVYQKGLDLAHVKYTLSPSWQKKIEEIILGIKTSADRQALLRAWKEVSNEFLEAGIDTVILACTDLNVIFKGIHHPFQIVDSSLCLAEATVQKWQEIL